MPLGLQRYAIASVAHALRLSRIDYRATKLNGRTQLFEYSPRNELTKRWNPYPVYYWTLEYDYRGNL